MVHPKNRFDRRKVNNKFKKRRVMDTPSTEIRTFDLDMSIASMKENLRPLLENFLFRSGIIKEGEEVIELNLEPFFNLKDTDFTKLRYTIQKVKESEID